MFKPLSFVFVLFTLASCASMESYEAQYCSYDRAYVKGFDDGSKGMNSRIDEFASCSTNGDQAMKGYREGFEKGVSQTQATNSSNGNSGGNTNNGTIVNIGIGGGGVGLGRPGYDNSKPVQNDRAFYCEYQAFTSHFEAFGPTLLEAQRSVRLQCEQKYNRMHCDDENDLKCRKNM